MIIIKKLNYPICLRFWASTNKVCGKSRMPIYLESELKLPNKLDIHICILYLWTDLGKPSPK